MRRLLARPPYTGAKTAMAVLRETDRHENVGALRSGNAKQMKISSLLALVLAILTFGASAKTPQPVPAQLLDRPLQSLGGPSLALRHFLGHPIVLNIWATWCPPCQAELPLLERAHLGNRSVRFVGVDQGETRSRVGAFVQQRGVSYPVLLDPAEIFGAAAGFTFPTTVFIDASGRIVTVHVGGLDPASLQAGLASIGVR